MFFDCAFSQFGADVNRADHWGVTPMYLAATNAQLNVIRNLIAAGAELTYKNKVLFCSNLRERRKANLNNFLV